MGRAGPWWCRRRHRGRSGTASTALNSSLTGGGVTNGQGTMGTGVNVAQSGATGCQRCVPHRAGSRHHQQQCELLGTGNVAGSVQINNGGPGSVTGAPVPISPIPTYVTPGTGLGAAATGAASRCRIQIPVPCSNGKSAGGRGVHVHVHVQGNRRDAKSTLTAVLPGVGWLSGRPRAYRAA